MASLTVLNCVIEVEASVKYVSPNEWRYIQLVNAKKRLESRPLYRLKRRFLGIRWVNNWRWRRGCKTKSKEFVDEWDETYYRNHNLHYLWVIFTLPDYPSIQELSSERAEE